MNNISATELRHQLLVGILIIFHANVVICQTQKSDQRKASPHIEQVTDYELVTVLNSISLVERYRTTELSIKIYELPGFHGSAGFNSGEANTSYLIAVSEFDEVPEQSLFKVHDLFNPMIIDFRDSNPKKPVLTIVHGTDDDSDELILRISIEELSGT